MKNKIKIVLLLRNYCKILTKITTDDHKDCTLLFIKTIIMI